MKPFPLILAYIIGYIPITFGQAVLVDTLSRHRRRVSMKALVSAYVISYLLQACFYIFLPSSSWAMILNLFCVFVPTLIICVFFYHGTFLSGFFACSSSVFGVIGEFVAICIISIFANITPADMTNSTYYTLVGTILSGVTTTFLFLFAAFMCRHFQKTTSDIPKSYLLAMLSTFISCMIIAFTLLLNMLDERNLSAVTTVFILFLLIGINFFVLYLYRHMLRDLENKYRTILLEQRGEAYAHELQLVKKKTQEVRAVRHDLQNHAIVMQELLNQGKFEEAKVYINQFSKVVQSTFSYATSGCTELDSVINYKLDMAARAGVKIDFSLAVPTALGIDPLDINVIIGNLLDNAIEAARYCSDKTISLSIKLDREVLFIVIKNTYDGFIKKDTCGNFMTRKSNSDIHGLGMANIQRTVMKYNGDMKVNTDNNIFSVSIVMYPDPSFKRKDTNVK
ncbi:MAG: GHKL domain-containing protein [Clostridia bacterium]|nr:GHKL domain-containing protein [Clostridia bacterium]